MNTQNAYSYILIWLRFRFLQSLSESNLVSEVLQHLSDLESELGNYGFDVTVMALNSREVTTIVNDLSEREDAKIWSEIVWKLRAVINKIETTLFAEASTKKIYLVPQRRYNWVFLSEENHKLLGENIFDRMSEMAKKDFSSACRCILYGEATASAFHILRATEDTLKSYYKKHKKTKRLKTPMWWPMTTELKKIKKNKPNKVILSSLDLVRESYRNPTQHPEAFYTIDEAQNLFWVCIDLINKMIEEN